MSRESTYPEEYHPPKTFGDLKQLASLQARKCPDEGCILSSGHSGFCIFLL